MFTTRRRLGSGRTQDLKTAIDECHALLNSVTWVDQLFMCKHMGRIMMKKSTKGIKDTGVCSIFWNEFKMQKRVDTLHRHGHGGGNGGRCPGSYMPPNPLVPKSTASSQQTPNLVISQSKEKTDQHSHASRKDGHSAHPSTDNSDASSPHL